MGLSLSATSFIWLPPYIKSVIGPKQDRLYSSTLCSSTILKVFYSSIIIWVVWNNLATYSLSGVAFSQPVIIPFSMSRLPDVWFFLHTICRYFYKLLLHQTTQFPSPTWLFLGSTLSGHKTIKILFFLLLNRSFSFFSKIVFFQTHFS